jgi:hypothetical protein
VCDYQRDEGVEDRDFEKLGVTRRTEAIKIATPRSGRRTLRAGMEDKAKLVSRLYRRPDDPARCATRDVQARRFKRGRGEG